MKDFSRKKELATHPFTMDGDSFEAVVPPPAMAILNVSRINEARGNGQIEIITEFLDQVLTDESAQLIAARMRDKRNPIEISQLADLAVWLIEEVYVPDRPMEGPSSSRNGSETTGSSSTDGAQPTATTPGGSPPTGL